MPSVEVYTCLTGNSWQYARDLRANLKSTASKGTDLHFKSIIEMRKGVASRNAEGWSIAAAINNSGVPISSVGHARMLNVINRVKELNPTGDYILITDCDVAGMVKDWDLLFFSLFDKETGCVGTPKFCKVLSVFFTMFKTEAFMKSKPDFSPGPDKSNVKSAPYGSIEQGLQEEIYMLRHGTRIVQDTGWKVPMHLHRAGYKYKMLSYDYAGNTCGIPCSEHLGSVYSVDNRIILSHMGASHKTPYDSDKAMNWRSAVMNHLSNKL